MTEWDPSELLGVMERRGSLLRELGEGPKTKAELEAAMSVSRSTVDRGIRTLEERELVERTAEGYRQTLAGGLAVEEYDDFVERLRGVSEGAELLTTVDPDADVCPSMLAGARVVEAHRASPQRPAEVLYGVVESAEAVRGFSPSVHPQQVRTYSEQIQDGELTADLVVTDEVLERLASTYADEFEAALGTDDVQVYQTDADLPYSLTVAETPEGPVAGLMVYGDRGMIGCILNDSEEAVAWAEERFRRERESAVRVT